MQRNNSHQSSFHKDDQTSLLSQQRQPSVRQSQAKSVMETSVIEETTQKKKPIKDLSINHIQAHENSVKYAKHRKALNEAQATLTIDGFVEEVDQNRKNAEKRREQAAYFQEKERIAAITKDNTKLFKRIAGAQTSIDNSPTRSIMMHSMQHSSSKDHLVKTQRNQGKANMTLRPIKMETLHHNVRMREQERIKQQNAENQKWLQAVKPMIDVRKQLKEFKYKVKIKQSIQRPMKQYLIYNQNMFDQEPATGDFGQNNNDSYIGNRPDSQLVLPSLGVPRERDSPVRSSVFKGRSFSTNSIKKKYHSKMHIKIRKQSLETSGHNFNRQAGTGSIDEIPSIKIIEPAGSDDDNIEAAKETIDSAKNGKPQTSRSPKMQKERKIAFGAASASAIIAAYNSEKKQPSAAVRMRHLRSIYGTTEPEDNNLPTIDGSLKVKVDHGLSIKKRKAINKTVDSEVNRVLNAAESRLSMLKDSDDEVNRSLNFSNRNKDSKGNVVVVEKSGSKWASVRVDSVQKFNTPYRPKLNPLLSNTSGNLNSGRQAALGTGVIHNNLINNESQSSLGGGINLQIVEPSSGQQQIEAIPSQMKSQEFELAAINSQSQSESAEIISVKKQVRESPVNQSQPDMQSRNYKGKVVSSRKSINKSRLSIDLSSKASPRANRAQSRATENKIDPVVQGATPKEKRSVSTAIENQSSSAQANNPVVATAKAPKVQKNNVTPKKKKPLSINPVANAKVTTPRKTRKSPTIKTGANKAAKVETETPQEKSFNSLLAQAKKPQQPKKKKHKKSNSQRTVEPQVAKQVVESQEDAKEEVKEEAKGEVEIELDQSDIVIAKDTVTQQSPVQAEEKKIEIPLVQTQKSVVIKSVQESSEYTQIQSEAYTDEFEDGEKNKSDEEESEHLATVQQEPIETTQGNQDDLKTTKFLEEKARAIFEEKEVPPPSEAELDEPLPITNEQNPFDVTNKVEDAPELPELVKKPFVAEEPDIFEPEGLEVPSEPSIDQQESSRAPDCPELIKKPFYVEDDAPGQDQEPTPLIVPSDTIPQQMDTEEPDQGEVQKVPFYVADDRAPTEPSAPNQPNESASILITAQTEAPQIGQVPQAPFVPAEAEAEVASEPAAVTTPAESMTVLQTAENDNQTPQVEIVIAQPHQVEALEEAKVADERPVSQANPSEETPIVKETPISEEPQAQPLQLTIKPFVIPEKQAQKKKPPVAIKIKPFVIPEKQQQAQQQASSTLNLKIKPFVVPVKEARPVKQAQAVQQIRIKPFVIPEKKPVQAKPLEIKIKPFVMPEKQVQRQPLKIKIKPFEIPEKPALTQKPLEIKIKPFVIPERPAQQQQLEQQASQKPQTPEANTTTPVGLTLKNAPILTEQSDVSAPKPAQMPKIQVSEQNQAYKEEVKQKDAFVLESDGDFELEDDNVEQNQQPEEAKQVDIDSNKNKTPSQEPTQGQEQVQVQQPEPELNVEQAQEPLKEEASTVFEQKANEQDDFNFEADEESDKGAQPVLVSENRDDAEQLQVEENKTEEAQNQQKDKQVKEQPQPEVQKPQTPVLTLQAQEEKIQELDDGLDLPVEVSKLDRSVFAVTNRLRSNPSSFIPLLQERLTYFDGDVLRLPGRQAIRSNEGPSAVHEAIEFLKTAPKVQQLKWSPEMALAAKDHTQDTGTKGITGHKGSDDSQTSDRLERYGRWSGGNAENVSYGKDFGINVVMQLLVDDGVPSRGHRRNIFDEDFTITGCFSGPHTTQRKMTCIVYADSYLTLIEAKKQDKLTRKVTLVDAGPPPAELEDVMDAFLKEEVVFKDMPENCKGYSQSMKVDVVGRKATKTVTRTCKLVDDTEVVLTVTESRTFAKMPGGAAVSGDETEMTSKDQVNDQVIKYEDDEGNTAGLDEEQLRQHLEEVTLVDQVFDLTLPVLPTGAPLVQNASPTVDFELPEVDEDFRILPIRAIDQPPDLPQLIDLERTLPNMQGLPAASFRFSQEFNVKIDQPPQFMILMVQMKRRLMNQLERSRSKKRSKSIHLTMPTIRENRLEL